MSMMRQHLPLLSLLKIHFYRTYYNASFLAKLRTHQVHNYNLQLQGARNVLRYAFTLSPKQTMLLLLLLLSSQGQMSDLGIKEPIFFLPFAPLFSEKRIVQMRYDKKNNTEDCQPSSHREPIPSPLPPHSRSFNHEASHPTLPIHYFKNILHKVFQEPIGQQHLSDCVVTKVASCPLII
jgi:hypothetical protein